MIVIYERDAADFTNNGLGTLDPVSCIVTETMNGSFEVTLTHPIDEAGKFTRIQEERIIRVPVPAGRTPRMQIAGARDSREIYKVLTESGARLHLRSGASLQAKIIGAYKVGTEVVIIDRLTDTEWSEVITPDGKRGWMWKEYLDYDRTEMTGEAAEESIREPMQLRDQPFRIYKVEPTLTGITAYARHIFYDLMDNMISSYTPGGSATGAAAFTGLAGATEDEHGFTFYSNLDSTAEEVEITDKNPAEAILDDGGLIENYGGELARDWWDVYLAKRIGEETSIHIREGKNLLGIKYSVDTTNVVTRVIPKGEDEDGNPLYLNGRYRENEAEGRPVYVNNKYGVIEVKEAKVKAKGEDKRTEAECIELMEKAAKEAFEAGCDLPDVTLQVDFIDCAETEEYRQYRFLQGIHMGDTVKVIARRVGVEVAMRMTQYSYDCLTRKYTKMTLGTIDQTIEGNMINPRSIGSGTIKGSMIKLGSIGTGALMDGAVNGLKIALAAIDYAHIGTAAIDQLAANAVTAIRADIRKLVAGNITTDQLYADLAVIAAAQITAANIEKANIQWAEIENLAVEIAKVVNAEIAKAEIDWAQIKNAQIDAADITNLTAAVAVIVKAEIALAEIDWAQIKNVEVGTAQIKLGAITQALIAAGAIGTAQIADGSITSAKVVDLSADVIKSGTLSTERLLIKGAGGLFYEINATAGGLTASQLTEEQYKNAISGTALVARSVTADKIAAKTITANEIMSGTITAAEINVANLFAAEATIAALDNYILRTQTIEAIEGQLDVWASEKIRLAVDNIQVGGTNLVCIGEGTLGLINGFADRNWGKSAWCQSGVGVILWIPNSDYNGVHFNTNIPVSAGKYTLSFYAWSYGVDVQPVLRCNLFNGTAGIDHYFYDVLIQPNTPTRYEIPVTVSYQEIVNLRMLTWTQWTTGEMYISDVKFEKGTKATDWSPAPGDTDAAIDKLSAELVIQEGDITANATKIETVNTAAGNAQSAANAAQNTANAAQNAANTAQGTANGAVTRVTAAETRISAVEGAIVNKVEKTEFDTLGRTVSDMQTSIEENGEEILFLAGRTVGGTNLLRNTGVLKAANYSFDASGASAMGGYEEDGEGGFHIWCQNANVRWWLGDQPVTSGQDYVTSVRYRINAAGNQAIQFQYVLKNASNDAVNYWDSVNHGTTSTITEDGWTVLRNAITIPDGASVVRIAVRTGVDGALYTCDYNVRRPKFEAGNMPTDWTPSPYDPSNGVDTGNSSVKERITPDTFDVDVPGTDGDFTLNRTGARIPIVNADIVNAQNLAYRYYGAADIYVNAAASSAQIAAGSHYRSLTDALNALSGKYIPYDVRIHVESDTYGDAAFNATSGCAVVINGNGYTLYGSIMNVNSACSLDINNLTVNRPSASGNAHALYLYRCGYTSMYQCTFIAAGTDTAVNIAQGVKVFMHDCELRSADKLIYLWYNSELQALNLKGGECTNYLVINGATARWGGTRPDGVYAEWNTSLMRPDDLNGLTIDYGTAQPSVPAIQTASWNYLYSDSYRSGWQWFSDDDIRQGYDGGVIYGVIWFDAAAIRSALNGKTINQVSLRLYMHKGVGRGVNVNVELYGSNVSYDRTAAPALTTSYGSIGETQPDVVNEITIPAQAVKDMISGVINALVLRSSDSEYHKDRPYSRNYARFAGSTTATAENCPRLTVVYQ